MHRLLSIPNIISYFFSLIDTFHLSNIIEKQYNEDKLDFHDSFSFMIFMMLFDCADARFMFDLLFDFWLGI